MWKKIEADMAQSIRAEITSPSNVGHVIDSVKIVRPGQAKDLLLKKTNQLRQANTATLRLLLLVLLNIAYQLRQINTTKSILLLLIILKEFVMKLTKAGKEKERKRRLIVLSVMLRKSRRVMRKRGRLGNKYLS